MIAYMQKKHEQADYTILQSFYNVVAGTLLESLPKIDDLIKFTDAIAQGWRPVGPLYSAGSSTYSNKMFYSSPTIFYK